MGKTDEVIGVGHSILCKCFLNLTIGSLSNEVRLFNWISE